MTDAHGEDDRVEAALSAAGAEWRAARALCPDPELLLARQSEALEPHVREALARHLDVCDPCARFVDGMAAVGIDVPSEDVVAKVYARVAAGRRRTARWYPLAAILVLAVGGAALWWMVSHRGPAADVVAGGTPVAEPPSRPAASPPRVVALWTVEPPPVRLSMSALGPTRSSDGSADVSRALVQALEPYTAGRPAESVAPLEALERSHPEGVDVAFYLGVAYLLSDRPIDATTMLTRARDLAPQHQIAEIDWYLASAEHRAGRVEASRARLDTLCGSRSAYRERACGAVAKLR